MKKVNLFVLFSFLSMSLWAQVEQGKDSAIQIKEVMLYATRAKDKSPFAHSNVTQEELKSKNLSQDLPILIDQMPSVVTTSDAGAGVGYTGIRVRGSDATRVNVTLNGIPFNDAESHGTYWVDLPDFTASVEDIQLQRGVGTSTNGAGAFGASLNLKTQEASELGYATISNTYGSFNTHKHSISLGSGIHNGFYAEGRISKIDSDGYIDRAFSDLFSHYLEAGYTAKNTSVKTIVFGGKEKTYQAWYGTPEAVVRGDAEGIEAFIDRNGYYLTDTEIENLRIAGRTYNHYLYDNEIDNYTQNHYQLHITHQFSKTWNASLSYNFTHGEGYYEQYKNEENLSDYFSVDEADDSEGDVIRRRWLDNDFNAIVYSFNYKEGKTDFSLGGGYNWYNGAHFGEIIWDSFATEIPIRSEYYRNIGDKSDFNLYAKLLYTLKPKLYLFGDAQLRTINYKAHGLSSDLLNINTQSKYQFFNPKVGLTYKINNHNTLYTSFAVAHREPNRDDLVKNPIKPKPERLYDWEAGYQLKKQDYYLTANTYFMNYQDQLVLTGALDDVGDPIRENVADSYRAGIEIQAGTQFSKAFKWDINLSMSQNKIKEYNHIVYDEQYDENWNTVSYEPIATTYKNTDISFSPNVIGGSTFTYKPTQGASVALISKYVGRQYLDNTSNDNKSINGYFVNNLSMSYQVNPKWIKEISFNVLINNLFNKMYESNGYTYSYYYRPLGSTDDAVTENFYYPQAGIHFLSGVTLKF